ncbi:hypothetical protein ACS0TY_002114 [Phlomoides rotata]
MYVFELQELEDATDGFSPSRLIGKGSHGCVYRGTLTNGDHVAVKRQSLGLQKLQDNTKLENEALILSSIIPNPCIINFLGISLDACRNTILVTEYMSNGTLHHSLHVSTTPPPWPKRVEIAFQLAEALCCLHESKPSIVHRDIKSANILFHDNWNIKLADFGLAMRLHSQIETKQLPAGTIGYIDPSYTTPNRLSTKIDVFSFGVVLLELVSGRKAIDMSKSPASIVEWAIPLIKAGRAMEICDKRVPLSVYTRRGLGQLLDVTFRCLSCKRPSMKEVVADLESLIMEPIDRSSWSMNYIREMAVSMMMRRKKIKSVSEECSKLEHDDDNNISKGRLLIREILADISLK